MKLSFVSAMRKAVVALTIATLGAAGLAATPALAGGVTYATGDSIASKSVNVNTTLNNAGEVTVPEGATNVSVDLSVAFAAGFFTDHVGQSISIQSTITGPDNTVITDGQTYSLNGSPFFYFCNDATPNVCKSNNDSQPQASTLTVLAGQTHGSVNFYNGVSPFYSPTDSMEIQKTIPAGVYKFVFKLTADGVEVPFDGTKVAVTSTSTHYDIEGSTSYTVGANIDSANLTETVCVDSAKIVAGDVLTPTLYLNDSAQTVQGWNINFITRNGSAQNNRSWGGNQSTTVTVNSGSYDDINDGLAVRMYLNRSKFAGTLNSGDSFTWNMAIVNQDGADVTGSCRPGAAGKPTLALNPATNSLTATISSSPKFADASKCLFYKSTDLNTVVATSWAWSQMPNTAATCSLSSASPGSSYVVKVQGIWYSLLGALSEASDSVLIPTPGFTVSPAVSGVTDVAGKVSVVSTNIDSYSSAISVRVSADGKGGSYRLYTFSTPQSCPPNCMGPIYSFKLKQTNDSGYVSNFAGTGTVEFSPTGANAGNTNLAWYGQGASKWSIVSANMNTSATPPAGQLEVLQGTTASATTTSLTVNKAELDATCAEAAPGSSSSSSANGSFVNASPVNAPTSNQLVMLYCYKPALMSDNVSTGYLPNPVLVSVDGNNALTVVKALGEFSASVNSSMALFSANPAAGANDVALTVFVTKKLVTAVNGLSEMAATVAGREIVRVKGNLTSTVTTSAWGGATGTSTSLEPANLLPQVNSGEFFVVQRVPGMPMATYKLAKVSSAGTMGTAVEITNDASATLAISNMTQPLGIQAGSSSAIQLVGVASSPMPNQPLKVSVLSVNTATGAGKAGEIVSYTQSGNLGLSSAFVLDSANNVNWWFTDSAAGTDKMSIYKWRDHLYVKPTGPVPAVTAIDLQYATNTPAAGTKVTFTGTNLDLTTAVKFGTVAATIGTKTATSLQVTVPAGSTGTVAITLESANGNGDGGNFTYVGTSKVAQTVTLDAGSANAKVGDADRTVSATVSMTGYTAVASLTYSSTTTSVCSVTGTTLKFLTKGTCTVKATQAGSSWTAEGVDTKSITVVGPTPTVTSQVAGKATNTPDAGTKLTIAGTNLGEVDAVKFGTVAATIGTRSATSLEVTVPAGSKGTVNITLAYSGGTVTAGTFEYVGAAKVAQAVTLNSGSANAAVGDADRTLSATVSMTGYTAVASLTYSSTTTSVCSVTGTTLKFLTKGTCTVKATQAGSVWAAEGVATANISVSGPADQVITVRTVLVGEKQINPDGIFISAKASSGLDVKLVFSTPTVCKKGTYSAFHVINLKTGSCKISVVQEGNAEWAPATKLVTYTVTPAGTKNFADPGNVDEPVSIGSAGAKVNVLSEVVSFKKSTGALTISSKGVWVGPIVATATFKISGKSYTCTLKYGTLNAVSAKLAAAQKTFAPATSFCAGTKTTDKAAVAALKKITEPVEVKITVWRDLHNPAKYATRGTQIQRTIYVTIG